MNEQYTQKPMQQKINRYPQRQQYQTGQREDPNNFVAGDFSDYDVASYYYPENNIYDRKLRSAQQIKRTPEVYTDFNNNIEGSQQYGYSPYKASVQRPCHTSYSYTRAPTNEYVANCQANAYARQHPTYQIRKQPCSSGSYHNYQPATYYNNIQYRSSPQIPEDSQNGQFHRPNSYVIRNGLKYPVTFKTPKYYNRPSPSAILNRQPSTLCLPVLSQPDPANYRPTSATRKVRQKSSDTYSVASSIKISQKKTSKPIKKFKHPEITESQQFLLDEPDIDDKDDFFNELEARQKFQTLENIAATLEEGDYDEVNSEQQKDIANLVKTLKPRVPSSIKLKKRTSSLIKNPSNSSISSTKTTAQDNLEIMLEQLKRSQLADHADTGNHEKINLDLDNIIGFANAGSSSINKTQQSKASLGSNGENRTENKKKESVVSFNYEEISQRMSPSVRNEFVPLLPKAPKSVNNLNTNQNATAKVSNMSLDLQHLRTKSQRSVKTLDEDGALELHRSKSYIVQLIDRALSRELGTVPATPSDFQEVSFQKLETSESQMEVKPSVLFTSPRSDNSYSNLTLQTPGGSTQSQVCLLTGSNCLNDEPLYIKQLRELRFGHLKHIQQEVKRLEDLERFLDNCTNDPNLL